MYYISMRVYKICIDIYEEIIDKLKGIIKIYLPHWHATGGLGWGRIYQQGIYSMLYVYLYISHIALSLSLSVIFKFVVLLNLKYFILFYINAHLKYVRYVFYIQFLLNIMIIYLWMNFICNICSVELKKKLNEIIISICAHPFDKFCKKDDLIRIKTT